MAYIVPMHAKPKFTYLTKIFKPVLPAYQMPGLKIFVNIEFNMDFI